MVGSVNGPGTGSLCLDAKPAGDGVGHIGDDAVVGQVQGGLHGGADREQSGSVGEFVAVGLDDRAGFAVFGADLDLADLGGDLLVVRQGDVDVGLRRNPGVILCGEQEVGLDVHGVGL